MVNLINKQLLLTAYAYLFLMEQQKEQQGSEAFQLQVDKTGQKEFEDRSEQVETVRRWVCTADIDSICGPQLNMDRKQWLMDLWNQEGFEGKKQLLQELAKLNAQWAKRPDNPSDALKSLKKKLEERTARTEIRGILERHGNADAATLANKYNKINEPRITEIIEGEKLYAFLKYLGKQAPSKGSWKGIDGLLKKLPGLEKQAKQFRELEAQKQAQQQQPGTADPFGSPAGVAATKASVANPRQRQQPQQQQPQQQQNGAKEQQAGQDMWEIFEKLTLASSVPLKNAVFFKSGSQLLWSINGKKVAAENRRGSWNGDLTEWQQTLVALHEKGGAGTPADSLVLEAIKCRHPNVEAKFFSVTDFSKFGDFVSTLPPRQLHQVQQSYAWWSGYPLQDKDDRAKLDPPAYTNARGKYVAADGFAGRLTVYFDDGFKFGAKETSISSGGEDGEAPGGQYKYFNIRDRNGQFVDINDSTWQRVLWQNDNIALPKVDMRIRNNVALVKVCPVAALQDQEYFHKIVETLQAARGPAAGPPIVFMDINMTIMMGDSRTTGETALKRLVAPEAFVRFKQSAVASRMKENPFFFLAPAWDHFYQKWNEKAVIILNTFAENAPQVLRYTTGAELGQIMSFTSLDDQEVHNQDKAMLQRQGVSRGTIAGEIAKPSR